MHILILTICTFISFATASSRVCGSDHGLSDEEYSKRLIHYHEVLKPEVLSSISSSRDLDFVPIQFHIVRQDDGSGGLDENQLWPVLDSVNSSYSEGGNVYFYHPGEVQYINSSQYYVCDNTGELDAIRYYYGSSGVLDIYFVEDATASNFGSICGISSFTDSSIEGIVIVNGCWGLSDGTAQHEIGHYFDLYHTHQTPIEYVNGDYCSYRGDGICDTPADPDLSEPGHVSSSCIYTGSNLNPPVTDGYGQLFDDCQGYGPCELYGSPDTRNWMNYNLYDGCTDHFSEGQWEKLQLVLNYTGGNGRADHLHDPLYGEFQLEQTSYAETSGDFDGNINPGESVSISFDVSILDFWPTAANNSMFFLFPESDLISVSNNGLEAGTISPGQTFTNADNPFNVTFSPDIPLGMHKIMLYVTSDQVNGQPHEQYNLTFDVEVSLHQSGFPFLTEFELKGSPLVIDVDNDGTKEIIFGDNSGRVNVLTSSGDVFGNGAFPYQTGDQIWASPAAADMNGDGVLEFTVGSKDKKLYIFDKDGLVSQYESESWLMATPSIGNLDSDDDLEVVVGGYSSNMKKIFAVNYDGSTVQGFPYDIGERMLKGVALADFDGNGTDDIVVGTDSKKVHLIYTGETQEQGFVFETSDKVQSSPAIADFNGEKVVFVGDKDGFLYAINENGSLRFQNDTGSNIATSPILGVAGSGDYAGEFVVAYGNDDGDIIMSLIDGHSETIASLEGAVTGLSVAVTGMTAYWSATTDTGEGRMYFFRDDDLQNYFPIAYENSFVGHSTIDDIDGDGDLEVLAGTTSTLFVADYKEGYPDDSIAYEYSWNTYKGDNQRSSFRSFDIDLSSCSLSDVNADGITDILDIVQTIAIIMGTVSPNPDQQCASDLNFDGITDILDIIMIVNIIMGN